MTSYQVFLRDGRRPVLLRDGFSFWAFLFGPLWLLLHTAWIPAALVFAAELVLGAVLHGPAGTAVGLGIAWLVGLHGQDMRGWSLARRGWRLSHIVVGRDAGSALVRLLDGEPGLHAAAAL